MSVSAKLRAVLDEQAPLELTAIERMLLEGLMARDREIQRVVAPLQRDYAEVTRQIADRAGIAPERIGTTHRIDTDTWALVPMPVASEQGREGQA